MCLQPVHKPCPDVARRLLNIRLLQRSTRQLSLTEEGKRVYQHAKMLQDILSEVDGVTQSNTPSGRVSITMNHDIGHHFVLPAIQEFVKQYPEVNIDFVLDDDRVDLISEEVDLAIRIGIPKDTSLIARVLYEEDFALYAHPDFLEIYGYPKQVYDLNALSWVILDLPNWNNAVRLHKQNSTKIVNPTLFHRCNSPFMVQKMAASGMGVALMLPATVRDQVSAG